mmetsp:Transcript_28728/g.73721  ORF Transcript_28728/g.73721 Transcript_28728/m.73721 type:complete len:202 (+) Transcript_28728:282-887(+)
MQARGEQFCAGSARTVRVPCRNTCAPCASGASGAFVPLHAACPRDAMRMPEGRVMDPLDSRRRLPAAIKSTGTQQAAAKALTPPASLIWSRIGTRAAGIIGGHAGDGGGSKGGGSSGGHSGGSDGGGEGGGCKGGGDGGGGEGGGSDGGDGGSGNNGGGDSGGGDGGGGDGGGGSGCGGKGGSEGGGGNGMGGQAKAVNTK